MLRAWLYWIGKITMGESIRFLWNATRGNRLRPWRSPYLRWRLETYSGKKAETIGAGDLFRLVMEDKTQFLRFLRWTGEIKEHAKSNMHP